MNKKMPAYVALVVFTTATSIVSAPAQSPPSAPERMYVAASLEWPRHDHGPMKMDSRDQGMPAPVSAPGPWEANVDPSQDILICLPRVNMPPQ